MSVQRALCQNALSIRHRYHRALFALRAAGGRTVHPLPRHRVNALRLPFIQARYASKSAADPRVTSIKSLQRGDDCVQGTLVTKTPGQVTLRDITDTLAQSAQKPQQPYQPLAHVVVFVSRGLVHLLDTPERVAELIAALTRKACFPSFTNVEREDGVSEASALVVVVDKVPTPDHALTAQLRKRLGDGPSETAHKFLGEGAEACEGIAYHASSHRLFQSPYGDHDYEIASPPSTDVASSSEGTPLLELNFQSLTGDGTEKNRPHTTITLPIANTVFQNGQQYDVSWALLKVQDGHPQVVDLLKLHFTKFPVTLPWPELMKINEPADLSQDELSPSAIEGARIRMPLSPLTAVRPIVNSMGNIVTKLYDEANHTAIPASQELEAAVSKHLDVNNFEAQGMTVWALVIPKTMEDSYPALLRTAIRKWQGEKLVKDPDLFLISQLVWYGAKLRRVLSGGGGWGQKAGLLSLDPDDQYKVGASASPSVPSFLADVMTDHSLDIPNVARAGDVIAFFAFNEEAITQPDQSSLDKPSSPWSLSFGVTPSTLDAMPETLAASEPSPESGQQFVFFPGHFGALSEGGMSLQRARENVQTKLDVPNTRFSFSTAEKGDDGHSNISYKKARPQKAVRRVKTEKEEEAPKVVRTYSAAGDAQVVRRIGNRPVEIRKFIKNAEVAGSMVHTGAASSRSSRPFSTTAREHVSGISDTLNVSASSLSGPTTKYDHGFWDTDHAAVRPHGIMHGNASRETLQSEVPNGTGAGEESPTQRQDHDSKAKGPLSAYKSLELRIEKQRQAFRKKDPEAGQVRIWRMGATPRRNFEAQKLERALTADQDPFKLKVDALLTMPPEGSLPLSKTILGPRDRSPRTKKAEPGEEPMDTLEALPKRARKEAKRMRFEFVGIEYRVKKIEAAQTKRTRAAEGTTLVSRYNARRSASQEPSEAASDGILPDISNSFAATLSAQSTIYRRRALSIRRELVSSQRMITRIRRDVLRIQATAQLGPYKRTYRSTWDQHQQVTRRRALYRRHIQRRGANIHLKYSVRARPFITRPKHRHFYATSPRLRMHNRLRHEWRHLKHRERFEGFLSRTQNHTSSRSALGRLRFQVWLSEYGRRVRVIRQMYSGEQLEARLQDAKAQATLSPKFTYYSRLMGRLRSPITVRDVEGEGLMTRISKVEELDSGPKRMRAAQEALKREKRSEVVGEKNAVGDVEALFAELKSAAPVDAEKEIRPRGGRTRGLLERLGEMFEGVTGGGKVKERKPTEDNAFLMERLDEEVEKQRKGKR